MKRYLELHNLSSIDDIKNVIRFVYIFKSFTDLGKYFLVIRGIKYLPMITTFEIFFNVSKWFEDVRLLTVAFPRLKETKSFNFFYFDKMKKS